MKITLATSDVLTITLNTDTLAIRPVHAPIDDDEGVELATRLIHPIVDEEMSDGVELVDTELSVVIMTITGDDLSLSYSTLLIVKTPYTWNAYSISCCSLGDPVETTDTGNAIVWNICSLVCLYSST